MERLSGPTEVRVINVIEVKAKKGLGIEKDPVREVIQYWDFQGNFLAEMDKEHCKPLIEYDAKVVKESIYAEAVPHP